MSDALSLKCDLCGKEVPLGRMMAGGPFNVLCGSCELLANKTIDRYLKHISSRPLCWFAKTIMDKQVVKK